MTIPFEIRNRWTNEVQVTAQIDCPPDTPESLKLGLAVRWAVKERAKLRGVDLREVDLREADLRGANLCGADLSWVDLSWVDLSGADLSGADLSEAYLSRASLRGAKLRGAKLCGASLRGAYLRGVDLFGADLSEANMREANLSMAKNIDSMVMPDGLTFAEYKRDVVPALLTAGGKTLDEIREAGAWDCHEWSNCPMHVAFGVNHTTEMVGPFAIYRQRADEFIQFFDAGLIPAPWEPVAALARLEDTHD
jgi:hypothetical protein